MARVLTKCPECGQKISNRFECRNCGLLFNRYFEAQARKREAEKARAAKRSRNIFILNATLSAIVVICLLGGGFYLWSSKEEKVETSPSLTASPQPTATKRETATAEEPAPRRTAQQESSRPIDFAVNGITVVKSPWGVSTGFFIANDKLLTTKKSVYYNQERLMQETEQLNKDRTWLEEEQEKIQRLRERAETETNPEEKATLEENLAKREQQLEKRTLKYQESEEVVARLTENLENVTIDILTFDGRTFHMAYMDTSATYDLALLTVFDTGIAPVTIADRSLEEGEEVWTLGKNKTAIKGVFTGYSEEGLIRSDVPINPGYFGGPLVDRRGMVFGVSVTPPKELRKTGLAVPIAVVMQEFGL